MLDAALVLLPEFGQQFPFVPANGDSYASAFIAPLPISNFGAARRRMSARISQWLRDLKLIN